LQVKALFDSLHVEYKAVELDLIGGMSKDYMNMLIGSNLEKWVD